MSTWVVFNPTAGSGRGARAAESMEKARRDIVVRATSRAAGAIEVCREARRAGAERLVVIGGDGTISQAAQGLCLEEDGSRATGALPPLCIFPAGTGGDYRRTFELAPGLEACLARLDGTPRLVDVGLASFVGKPSGSGAPRTPTEDDASPRRTTAAFVNVLSFGVGGLTDRIVERGPKWLGGRASFFLGAFAATLSYAPVPIELELDGVPIGASLYRNVAVCLGRYFGGGMRIAPDAEPSDGLFDVVTIAGTVGQTLALTTDIYRGTHGTRDFVRSYRCRRLRARPLRASEVLIDADGEQPGCLPLDVELLPKALPLLIDPAH